MMKHLFNTDNQREIFDTNGYDLMLAPRYDFPYIAPARADTLGGSAGLLFFRTITRSKISNFIAQMSGGKPLF